MKILLYAWGGYTDRLLYEKMTELGYDIIYLEKECKDFMMDADVAQSLIFTIKKENVDAVLSYNYLPIVSMVCNTVGIDYYSWIYDSPELTLYAKSVIYDCNHIGIFDRSLCSFLKEIGIDNVYYAPLAVDTAYFDEKIGRAKLNDKLRSKVYSPDVSFVGSLYTDEIKCNLYSVFKKEAVVNGEYDENWKNMDEILADCMFSDGTQRLNDNLEAMTNILLPYMQRHNVMLGDNYFDVPEIIMRESILEKKISSDERMNLMKVVAEESGKTGYSFSLFTGSNTSAIPALERCNKGTVDYDAEMPFVFNKSRINLQITLRSIHTGIPLRSLDVLACGGFLLSNPQEELLENFDDGVHIAVYNDIEECVYQINRYLSDDDLRRRIAEAGKERVKDLFSYEAGLKRLFGA
ncbi:MAG: DUF3880 domain-containing protein [Lachnospiraceae bacterium]|nr:DUF3880 domain-containing protein [Lachnospiraceae bacterium]